MEQKTVKSVASGLFDYNDFVIPEKSEFVVKGTIEVQQVTEISDWPKEEHELLFKYDNLWKYYLDLMICVKTQVDDNDFFFERNCGRQCSLAAICGKITESSLSKGEVDPTHGALLLKAAEHGEQLLAANVAGHRIGLEQRLKQNNLKLTGRLSYKCYRNISMEDSESKNSRNYSHAAGFSFTVREQPRACDVFELLLCALAGNIDRAFLIVCHAYESLVKLYEINTEGYTTGDLEHILEEFKGRVKIKNIKGRFYQLAFVEADDIDIEQ